MNTSSQKKNRPHQAYGALLLLALCTVVAACGSDGQSNASGHGASCPSPSQLQGAGSTFDAPLFDKLFTVYPSVPCGVTVNYYARGSGTGLAELLSQLVDFGATDAPLTDRQLAYSPNGAILHIPVTLGAVAIGYHLTEMSGPLRLTGAVLAAIYLGHITSWDDAAIAQLNPGVSLPHRTISVLHRSDGSGTTAIFTHYLAAISPAWKSKVGAGTRVTWPTGQGEQGSEGVAEALDSTEGALGYVEYSYVVSHHLAAALLQNAAGTFLAPSIAGAQAAAVAFPTPPTDLRFYIVNAPSSASYPIAGYSWVIVYRQQADAEKGQALALLFWWMIHAGQQYAQPLQYASLPAGIVSRGEAQIRAMTCGSSHTSCYTS